MSNDSAHFIVRAEVSRELTAAVKARDRMLVNALRAALSALDNATAVSLAGVKPAHYGGPSEVPRRELTRVEIQTLLQDESDKRLTAAAEFERLGCSDDADLLRREAAIIRRTAENVAALEPALL